MKITLIGMGMGSMDTLTLQAHAALAQAGAVIGSRRLLESLPPDLPAERVALTDPGAIDDWIAAHPGTEKICAVYSGDIGFYSGADGLRTLLERRGIQPESFCGISSGQYLCAKLGIPWQEVRMCSAHGRDCDILAEVLASARCLFLTGGDPTPSQLLSALCEAGLADCSVTVGERLSYPEERIVSGRARELLEQRFDSLSTVFVERRRPVFTRESLTGGIPDDAFVRGAVPMTKREVRSVILSHLALRASDIVWDIGAGTGSVAVEAALFARRGRVCAIERSPEGCALIHENRERFGVYNLRVIEGTAPEACESLPPPDAAFVGGTGGRLREILAYLLSVNPAVRITLSAVTLETMHRGLSAMEALGFWGIEAAQIAVSRAEATPAGHLLRAQNPVFLISGVGHG